MVILVSTQSDLEKAKKDAEHVNRLIKRGINPLDAFLELQETFIKKKLIHGL